MDKQTTFTLQEVVQQIESAAAQLDGLLEFADHVGLTPQQLERVREAREVGLSNARITLRVALAMSPE